MGVLLSTLGFVGTALIAATQVSAEQGTSNLGSWARYLHLTSLGVVLGGPGADRWGLYSGIALSAATLAIWRWKYIVDRPQFATARYEWLSLSEAVTRYCDPEFVSIRDRYVSTYHESLARYREIEANMQKTAEGGWNGRPEALKEYNDLRDRWERLGAVLTAAIKGLQDVWAVLRDELSQHLISGELISRGFAEPHVAGNNQYVIKSSEWRILEPSPDVNAATKKGDPTTTMYSGVEIASTHMGSRGERTDEGLSSPLEIIFDAGNSLRRFWSIEQAQDAEGKVIPGHSYWEYRVLIRNRSSKTLRNVKVTVEAIGPMPTRPEPSQFDINKRHSLDLSPHEEVLALLRRWFNPPIVAGMACGGAYGPIKVTVSADDVLPATKFFHFEPETTPMISEIIW